MVPVARFYREIYLISVSGHPFYDESNDLTIIFGPYHKAGIFH